MKTAQELDAEVEAEIANGTTAWGRFMREKRAKKNGGTPHYLPDDPGPDPDVYGTNGVADAVGTLGEWNAGIDPGPIEPRAWLLGNQFCRGYISSIVAGGGVGKSSLRLLQYISLASGRDLCRQHIFRRSRVLLISLEDDAMELHRRIKAVLMHYNIARSDLDGWLYCATPRLKLAVAENRNRSSGPLALQIREAVERLSPDLIALDPFVKTHSLQENDSGDMNFVCDLLAELSIEYNVAVDSPHHAHKGQVTPGDADNGRGSSGIKDAARLVYTLTQMSAEEAVKLGLSDFERRQYIRLDMAKVNTTPPVDKADWFKLVSVNIGNCTVDYPSGDSVQVAEPWCPPSPFDGMPTADINKFLDAISDGLIPDPELPGTLTPGQYYTATARGASSRWLGRAFMNWFHKSEAQAKTAIKTWLENGVLVEFEYEDPVQRKPKTGVRAPQNKRAGRL